MTSLIKGALFTAGGGRTLLKMAACTTVATRTIITSVHGKICGKSKRGNTPRKEKRPPFPYETKYYTLFQSLMDRTTHRFDANSKVIVVEGPVAVGKDKFCRELAEELEMKYYPEPNLDMYYINEFGFDLREVDSQVPEITRTYDHTNFCRNPHHPNAAGFQLITLHCRFWQYIDAVAHVLNTGQGVVLQRSLFSDFVFVEAMYAAGFISKEAKDGYYVIKANAINEMVKPHLVIYLDISVKEVQDRIKKRALPYEKDSKVFTDLYLSTMEKEYKQSYLTDIEKYSELLVYDWTGGGEADIVVEDIERIDFDRYAENFSEIKFRDWRLIREVDWADLRQVYTNQKSRLLNYFNIPYLEAPELIIQSDDYEKWYDVVYNHPSNRWDHGFNSDMGQNYFWKSIFTNQKNGRWL